MGFSEVLCVSNMLVTYKKASVEPVVSVSSLFRLSSSVREHHSNSIDWTLRSSARVDPVTTTDVVAPSPWTIFGCQNGMVHTQLLLLFLCGWNVIGLIIVLHAGLRLFKEAKERDSLGRVSIFLLS